MKAYKGTNENMVCRNFQYELGKEYTYEGEVELCKSGFHACLKPVDCLGYYHHDGKNRFFEVEIDGVSDECENDSKVAAKSIKFVREITDVNELLDGAEYIPHEAFYTCTSLTSVGPKGSGASVEIPDSVTKISSGAFFGCTGITSITIPDSVAKIGQCAFYNCSRLTSITIPDSVTSIGASAFAYCTSLTSIEISKSITSIEGRLFSDCSNLTSITIPDSVTCISYLAFYKCSSLTSITYTGTKSQWSTIFKVAHWNHEVPETCMVHCIDGDIENLN